MRRRVILCVVAAAVAGAGIGVALAAQRHHTIPFTGQIRAGLVTRTMISDNPPTWSLDAACTGHATELGDFTLTMHYPSIAFINGQWVATGHGTGTFVAANGDQLSLSFLGTPVPTADPNVVDILGAFICVGGTGRFTHAIAAGSYMGAGDIPTNSVVGTIHGEFLTGSIPPP